MTNEQYKQTELGIIPKEWEVARLGDYINEVKDKNNHLDDYTVYTISNVHGFIKSDDFFEKRVYSKNLKNYKIVQKNYFGYNPARVNVGSIALFEKDEICLVSPMYIVFEVSNPKNLNEKYLYRLLKSPLYLNKIQNASLSRGSVRNILSFSDLSNFLIPLPPLSEQKSITAVLDAVQSAIESTEKVIASLKELKKSAMKHLFTYGPVPFDQTEKVELKQTELGMIPKEWEVVRLGEAIKLTSGKTRPKNIYSQTSDKFLYPIYGGNGILGYAENYLINFDTIVLGRVGVYCGSVYLTNGKSWISDNALYVKEFLKDIDKKYLSISMENLNINRFKNLGGQPLISQSIVYDQKIPLPPLPIQQKIASILSAIDAKIEAEEKKLAGYKELFRSMLKELMSARLRVNISHKDHEE